MKTALKILLQLYLKLITRLVLFTHRPYVIAIAGSINKHFVKEEIARILKAHGSSVRVNPRSFNTEIGLPLAILNLPSGYNSYRDWLPVMAKAFTRIWQFDFPKYLVLELGTSDPGDMKYLLSLVKPQIAIITDISQRYLESFSDMDELVAEYKYLAASIPPTGRIIANIDNPRIRSLSGSSPTMTITYGTDPAADYQILSYEKTGQGQLIKVKHPNNVVTSHQINKFGRHHAYAFLTGLAISEYAAVFKEQL